MKSMIKLIGVIVLMAVMGIPAMAQASAPSVEIRVITAQPNAVSNLIYRSFSAGEKHFYRVNNLSAQFYYIFWRDEDNPTNLSTPIGDIKISVLNLSTNRVIVTGVDVDRTLNEERQINSIEITRGVHYSPGNDILIIVEGVINSDSGNYAILVY